VNANEAIEQLEAKAREVAGRASTLREENARIAEENRLLRERMEKTEAGGVDRKAVAERLERCVQILERALAEEGASTPE
jgi:hypothetical protein